MSDSLVKWCPHNGCTFSWPVTRARGMSSHIRSRASHLLNCVVPCAECARLGWVPPRPSEPREQCQWCGRWLLVGNPADKIAARRHQRVTCEQRLHCAPSGTLRACPHNGCESVFAPREIHTLPQHAACQFTHLLNCVQPCAECAQRGWQVTGQERYRLCVNCNKRMLLIGNPAVDSKRWHKHRRLFCPKRRGALRTAGVTNVAHSVIGASKKRLRAEEEEEALHAAGDIPQEGSEPMHNAAEVHTTRAPPVDVPGTALGSLVRSPVLPADSAIPLEAEVQRCNSGSPPTLTASNTSALSSNSSVLIVRAAAPLSDAGMTERSDANASYPSPRSSSPGNKMALGFLVN